MRQSLTSGYLSGFPLRPPQRSASHRLQTLAASRAVSLRNTAEGNTMFCSRSDFVLKVDDGTFVIAREAEDGPELYAADLQNGLQNALTLHMSTRDIDQKNQIALHCKHENHPYTLKVFEGTLKLEINNNCDHLTDHYWFEMDNQGAGEYYGLRSVVDPVKYLSITKRKVCVSDIERCVFFTTKRT